jgi:hypothetical protein
MDSMECCNKKAEPVPPLGSLTRFPRGGGVGRPL